MIIALCTYVVPSQASEKIYFERIKDLIFIQIENANNIILTTEVEWISFCSSNGILEIPEIDFEKYMVAGVFLGVKPNPGYGVEITSIKKKNKTIFIKSLEYIPNPLEGYIQVVAYPYDIVLFPKIDGEIIFSSFIIIR